MLLVGWGAPEANWTVPAVRAFDELFQQAARANITVVAASGDAGSSDGVRDGPPLLYEIKRSDPRAIRGITVGSNGAYRAGPGWNACTGLGSPDGALLLEALRKRRFGPESA